jgi:hypothetical protein
MGKYSNTIYDEALNNSWTGGCKKNGGIERQSLQARKGFDRRRENNAK